MIHRPFHIRTLAALTATVMAIFAAPQAAMAQDAGGNEVWLGQLGELNVLDILQEGRDNKAGADHLFLLLGQNGVGNRLTLVQFGYSNELGTLFADIPNYARGVWQRGDLNVIDITQRNSASEGSNFLGSVTQRSAMRLPTDATAFNTLTAIQTALDDPTGSAGHYIGRVVQVVTGDAASAGNTAFIVQRGGGLNEGNILANLRQVGSGNRFGSIQSGDLNRIGEEPRRAGLPIGGIVQRGTDNRGWVVQGGSRNLIEYLQQYGDENAARVRMSGHRNAISQIYQNNESWDVAGLGNRLSITITGDDNGGDGTGWVGELIRSPSLAMPGIAHAVFSQIGDDNDLTLVVMAGLETKYGMTQIGDGNDAHVAIAGASPGTTAAFNETAVFQHGDTNYVSHTVSGSNNTGAFRQEGSRNTVTATQSGIFNTARVAITGSDNTGDLQQWGVGGSELHPNSIRLDVAGDFNVASLLQSGSGNAMAVLQENLRNTSRLSQAGTGNSLAVHQF